MADTHGFEVVIEAAPPVLRKALRGAWKSAECGDTSTGEGRIPEYLPIPAGIDVGGFTTGGGQVEIPQDQLDAELLPAIDGARLSFGLIIQVVLANPPVPSARLLDLTATARADVPVGVLPGTKNVGIKLQGLARDAVSADVTSGDPLAPKLDQLIGEYVHLAYENGAPGGPVDPSLPTIPHEVNVDDLVMSFVAGSYTVDSHLEIYDDQADPAHRIDVSRPTPTSVLISLPVYLRIFNIRRSGLAPVLDDPMGIETRLDVTAALESPPGQYTLRFDTATVAVGAITPAPGVEGTNYTTNNARLFNLLEGALRAQLVQQGTTLVHSFGARTVAVPTVDQIAVVIADLMHADLAGRGFVALWTPEVSGEVFNARDVTTRVFADMFVIALNAQDGADIGALDNLVPAGREFVIALTGSVVRQSIEDARATNGWADPDLPRRVEEGGKKADVTELDVFLVDGAIRMTGKMTVIDAILGSIDVDARFRADVGLHWEPDGALNEHGVQRMTNALVGDPEVDPEHSVAFWIIAIILAIISFGAGSILIGIIIIVVAVIVTAIATSIGSSMAVDPVTGAVQGISGWPSELARIGRVRAVFFDPIVIAPDGLVIAGTMDVLSSCEETTVLAARSGGPYTSSAQQALTLAAANTDPAAGYTWLPGDGSPPVAAQDLSHVYAASGIYLAEHSLAINQPGGATSRHFALVHVANVAPTVDAGPDLEVDEGEVVTLVGTFSDVEYVDTHEATWNFGDNQPTAAGVLVETNHPPRAEGTCTVQHSWCDNGVYEVSLRIRDQNGGMATDTRTVSVRNVAPVVDAGPDLYTYPCTVLTLTAVFSDPGWCDTHTATWDFGDCTAPIPAVVTETHEPPTGQGSAVASHIYDRCGTFVATCTVVDDDGGVGTDTLVVRMTDVVNGQFENGFARRVSGDVANGWEPYVLPWPAAAEPTHAAELFIVREGRRSQGMRVSPGQRVGICQQIGANPDWAYQITAACDVEEAGTAGARLGVDPTGGTDPDSPNIVWSAATARNRWTPLTVRVTAGAATLTVFLEASGGAEGRTAAESVWFDDVELRAVQPFCPPEQEPQPPIEECVDFAARDPRTVFPAEWDEGGFRVRSLDGEPRRIAHLGQPPAGTALRLGSGIVVYPPRPASRVRVTLANPRGRAVEVRALDGAGEILDGASVPATHPTAAVTVTLDGPGIIAVALDGAATAGLLVRICAVLEPIER